MISGTYFDGRTPARRAVTLQVEGDSLHIHGLPEALAVALDEVVLSEPLGGTRRSIALPGGARLEVEDHPELAALPLRSSKMLTLVHALERRWPLALLSLLGVVVSIWLLITNGIPLLAQHAVQLVPPEVSETLAEQGLATLDRIVFEASELDEARAQRFRRALDELAAGTEMDGKMRLEFRRGGGLGANAFALPAGVVVLTDELVELAEHEDEVRAVLAHEMGHVVHRHMLRRLFQDSGVVLLLVVLTGDIASVTALGAALPAVLTQARYSREFEREADDYAYHYLERRGIPARRFGDMLRRLPIDDEHPGDELLNYFATHPPILERIRE